MSCTGTRITTLKQYKQLSQKLTQDLTILKEIMAKEKQTVETLTKICTDTLAQEPIVQCINCGSHNTVNRMGVLYSRFKGKHVSHTPYYAVCNDCGQVITPTPQQKLTLAYFVLGHETRYAPGQIAEAIDYTQKHGEPKHDKRN